MSDTQTTQWEWLHEEGYRHQLLGEWADARRYYEQALACKPYYALAQFALAQLQMMQSGLREGRELYESRFAARQNTDEIDWRGLPAPRWRGEPVTGKYLHLWVEQGFGDVMMFAGFLPWVLAQKPARITLSMFPKMMTLLARSFPQVMVESLQDIATYALSPAILDTLPQLLTMTQHSGLQIDLERAVARGNPDFTAPMGDLMVHGLADFIPAQCHDAYLLADPARVADIKKHLHPLSARRLVGISWHTRNTQSGAVRSVPLSQWRPILSVAGCHFISLQHHVPPQEIERFCNESGCDVVFDPAFEPIADTEGLVALTACMDEVITIDNSNAHLAGALGVPTTLMLPKGCDFRWPVLKGDTDTLWYRSVKVERQEQPMEWQPVVERIAARLRQKGSI